MDNIVREDPESISIINRGPEKPSVSQWTAIMELSNASSSIQRVIVGRNVRINS
jgi:hypothetical protein